MGWVLTDDAEDFVARAGHLLEADPLRHTVSLTVLRQHREGVFTSTWAYYESGDSVSGVASLTVGYPLLLAIVPDHTVGELVEALQGRTIDAVNGQVELARSFATLWSADSHERQGQRLFRLADLRWPELAGEHRLATQDDRELVLEWWIAFGVEAEATTANPASSVDDRLGYGGIVLWLVDGKPVSMAGVSRVSAGMARIGPVYTPPGQRSHGYAAMATAVATDLADQRGATTVCLFTDLANETTNRLYPRLGYEPVEDRLIIAFS